MNYNEMTAQQCADWLAEKDGWTWRPYAGAADQRLWTHPDGREELEYRGAERLDNEHGPYKLTLDAAAGALREPWKWDSIEWWDNAVIARYFDNGVRESKFPAFMQRVDGPDELTARYRAAVAARMEYER